jgi:hypothetical protein
MIRCMHAHNRKYLKKKREMEKLLETDVYITIDTQYIINNKNRRNRPENIRHYSHKKSHDGQ